QPLFLDLLLFCVDTLLFLALSIGLLFLALSLLLFLQRNLRPGRRRRLGFRGWLRRLGRRLRRLGWRLRRLRGGFRRLGLGLWRLRRRRRFARRSIELDADRLGLLILPVDADDQEDDEREMNTDSEDRGNPLADRPAGHRTRWRHSISPAGGARASPLCSLCSAAACQARQRRLRNEHRNRRRSPPPVRATASGAPGCVRSARRGRHAQVTRFLP